MSYTRICNKILAHIHITEPVVNTVQQGAMYSLIYTLRNLHVSENLLG